MDYEARIVKVEVLVDTLTEGLNRLHLAIEQLRQNNDHHFSEVWRELAELRKVLAVLAQELAELRHTTERLEKKVDDLQVTINAMVRWNQRQTLVIAAMIAGVAAKLLGLY